MRLFGEFTKVEEQDDGTLEVSGIASTGAVDASGEIVLPDAVKAALPDYLAFPTIREMHQPKAAGTTLEAAVGSDGVTRIVAKVVDADAIKKVREGVYRGFSIGGKVLARDAKDRKTITKIRLSEISLVDRPCNPEAVLDMWKAETGATDEDDMSDATVSAEAQPGADEAAVTKADDAAGAAETVQAEGSAGDTPSADDQPAGDVPAAPDPLARAEAAIGALAAAVEKVEGASEPIAKGMYEVSRFAELLSSLAYLVRCCQEEADYEKDNSPVPAKLRSALMTLSGVFKEMAAEEVDEFLTAIATKKAESAEAIGGSAGEGDDTAKGLGTSAEGMAKAEAQIAELLEKLGQRDEVLGKVAEQLEGLTGRIAKIEAQPAPPKTATVIAKGEDVGAGSGPAGGAQPSAEDIQKALFEMPAEERNLLLTKAALSRPIALSR